MTDRELLEAAAKAAGVELHHWTRGGEFVRVDPDTGDDGTYWDPIDDDGDALRLAVKLLLCFGPNFDGDTAVCFGSDGRNLTEPYGSDPYAATRRAIVRAAAALAKG